MSDFMYACIAGARPGSAAAASASVMAATSAGSALPSVAVVDSLDVMAVRIAYEHAVVARVVLGPLPGRMEHLRPRADRRLMDRINRGAVRGTEGDVQLPGLRTAGRAEPEAGNAVGAREAHHHALAGRETHHLVQPEWRKDPLVEGERHLNVGHLHAKMIEHGERIPLPQPTPTCVASRSPPTRCRSAIRYRRGYGQPRIGQRLRPLPGTGERPGPAHPRRCAMNALLVGYARCSTDAQDLTAQRDGLVALGVTAERVYVDHGLTGTNRDRPGLREALAACRAGDTLVVTKLDRLARSLPDARAIADELTARSVRLSLGASVYDPTDAVGRLLFNVLAVVAEFESDLIRLRTREGMKVAKAKGHLRGKQPKLSRHQEAHLVSLVGGGEYSTAEVAELFGVARSTVYRAIERERVRPRVDARTIGAPG